MAPCRTAAPTALPRRTPRNPLATRTIAELAARERELVEELTQVRAEIAARAGEIDPPKRKGGRRVGS